MEHTTDLIGGALLQAGEATTVTPELIKLDGDLVSLQVFAGAQGVRTDDPVRFLGIPMRVEAHSLVSL